MSQAAAALDEAGVPYEFTVASAHRSPDRTKDVITNAEANGAAVFIAGAGMAAHLPGVVASFTTRPVIGVPLASGALQGLDALYAIVQMPPGVPVATVGVGPMGAANAGHLAAAILALSEPTLRARLQERRRRTAEEILAKGADLPRRLQELLHAK
jgi:phosphoribosylaminoimidazole carboxylase PurE protein